MNKNEKVFNLSDLFDDFDELDDFLDKLSSNFDLLINKNIYDKFDDFMSKINLFSSSEEAVDRLTYKEVVVSYLISKYLYSALKSSKYLFEHSSGTPIFLGKEVEDKLNDFYNEHRYDFDTTYDENKRNSYDDDYDYYGYSKDDDDYNF